MTIRTAFESAWERKGIIVPGLPILPPGVERHPVPGGGSRAVPIYKGDAISIFDREGLQPGELVFFAPDQRSDAAMLGATGHGRPDAMIAVLANSPSGSRVVTALDKAGFDLARGDAIRIFCDSSRPGDVENFSAQCDGLLIIAAPGGPMSPAGHNPPSELVVYIRRAAPLRLKADIGPPDPLTDPLQDVNILPGTAFAYEVKKGEYIQIIDVKGRECSDFQAFSLRALDQGLEREIDPTTTRSLTGSLYPRPGLLSKYWTVDHEALIEIVQDNCGRHDTFGLACTARYYEDMGYPGHANCSDNINGVLAAAAIRPRAGWPAINFFFNTTLDDANAIGMDEPWSRPGDYVLLRALGDLLCVSTACPCDVDPANGWEPTDIQIRTYAARAKFSRSIGYRRSTEAEVEETKKTAFHDCFAEHTRNFVDYNGYWLPAMMTNHGAIAEYWACREAVAVMDLSPLRKYEVTGPDAEALLQLCVTRDMKKLAIGQVVYTAMCYPHGGMIDDGTVYRLRETNFRWIGGKDTSGLWLREQAEKAGMNAWVRCSTDQLHNIAVQGRHACSVLGQIFWTPPPQPTIEELPWFRFTIARLGDVNGAAVVISRTGYTGELGYEIFCHPKDAAEIFAAVWQSGQTYGMVPLGLAALDMLRIEAGLIFAGSEFDDQIDPMEAGIGFTVALKTNRDDFIGREVLEARKANPQRKLVGLTLAGGVVPSRGDGVYVGKAQIGKITSAVKSPLLGQIIAFGSIASIYAEAGTELEIGQLDGQQKRLQATITRRPHVEAVTRRVQGIYD